jgi:hypothetical protein
MSATRDDSFMSTLDIDSDNIQLFIFNNNGRSLFLSGEGELKYTYLGFLFDQVMNGDSGIL